MGCPLAPEIANLYMEIFEKHVNSQLNPFHKHLVKWFRYIDDIFIIRRGQENLIKYSLNNNTQFDMEYHDTNPFSGPGNKGRVWSTIYYSL